MNIRTALHRSIYSIYGNMRISHPIWEIIGTNVSDTIRITEWENIVNGIYNPAIMGVSDVVKEAGRTLNKT